MSEADIKASGRALPSVTKMASDAASPRGTIVIGYLRKRAKIDELRVYLEDFVRFVPTSIYFNGHRVARRKFLDIESRENLTEITGDVQEWSDGSLSVRGRLFEDQGNALVGVIDGLGIDGEQLALSGYLRFENGTIDVFKRGFKLCATQVATRIGVSGRIDCDKFVPTAGRDSLDAGTASLVGRIVFVMERVAVNAVLESSVRINQHTRVFRYLVQHDMIEKLDNVPVRLADGSEETLGEIRGRAKQGQVGVFFGVAHRETLSGIMHARGHVVVLLSHDRYRRDAERRYLERYCGARAFDGIVECVEHYTELDVFEKIVLSELELNIKGSYDIEKFRLFPGKLTEDIPVFVKDGKGRQSVDVFVDVRHSEVAKLRVLGFTAVFYSLVAAFCREYLGPSLKKWSPRFFGDGAINIEVVARRKSELWVLLNDDIRVVRRGEVVRRADVHTVRIGGDGRGTMGQVDEEGTEPRIIQIVGDVGASEVAGYYIRLPNSAFLAYGDLVQECDSLGVVWAGNKLVYIASDTISSAFQYEIRLDELAIVETGGGRRVEGAMEIEAALQSMFGGLYFFVPGVLQRFLIPQGSQQIRIRLYSEWTDLRTARRWVTKDSVSDNESTEGAM